jgi:hypothetical protein
MTKAESIAKRINSTSHLTREVGRKNLQDLAVGNGGIVEQRGDYLRYTFRDGSALIDKVTEWGIAKHPNDMGCWCLASEPHMVGCPAADIGLPELEDRICLQLYIPTRTPNVAHHHGHITEIQRIGGFMSARVAWDDPASLPDPDAWVGLTFFSKTCHGGGPTARSPRKGEKQ